MPQLGQVHNYVPSGVVVNSSFKGVQCSCLSECNASCGCSTASCYFLSCLAWRRMWLKLVTGDTAPGQLRDLWTSQQFFVVLVLLGMPLPHSDAPVHTHAACVQVLEPSFSPRRRSRPSLPRPRATGPSVYSRPVCPRGALCPWRKLGVPLPPLPRSGKL